MYNPVVLSDKKIIILLFKNESNKHKNTELLLV